MREEGRLYEEGDMYQARGFDGKKERFLNVPCCSIDLKNLGGNFCGQSTEIKDE